MRSTLTYNSTGVIRTAFLYIVEIFRQNNNNVGCKGIVLLTTDNLRNTLDSQTPGVYFNERAFLLIWQNCNMSSEGKFVLRNMEPQVAARILGRDLDAENMAAWNLNS